MTCSLDKTLKAWSPSADGKNLNLAIKHDLPMIAINLTKMSDTFIMCGLEDGTYHGWNLSNNAFDSIKAH